jgi:hypothetical protein
MSVQEQEPISIITLLRGEKEFIPLIKENFAQFTYAKDKLELIIIDDGKESLIDQFLDDERILYLHLSANEIHEFIGNITFPNDTDDLLKNYQTKTRRLPNGFKRDYGVGMSTHDLIFHMDYDTSYHTGTITRKVKFMKQNRVDCVYNSSILCHDFHTNDYSKLYKSDNPYHIYEGTILHTRDYWKNGGFKWSDITNEGRFFSDNHGQQRKMDNYYDAVKVLSIRNVQDYKPIALDLEQSEFTYELKKDIINQITLDYNPVKESMDELFQDIDQVNVLGIHSEFMESIKDDPRYRCHNMKDKIKQTKITKEINKIRPSFHVLLFGHKQPVWSLFEDIKFDCILLETPKNMEQMHSIIQGIKKYSYLYLNGVYVNKDILKVPE